VLPTLAVALANGHAVLSATTGSGKTTRVPLALLTAPWLAGQSILMLEPRRPAARMAAAYMAQLLGEPVGERVGHQVRFERRIGRQTRIQVLTEGILTRRIQSDPELSGCGLLIFDEFHERGLNADLGLALALDAATLRPDLRILVMSATLDTAATARLLGDAPIVVGDGRAHPVEIRYAEQAPSDPIDAVVGSVHVALREGDGDLLVFLPGVAEIGRVAARVAAGLGEQEAIDLLPLHGSLSLSEQDRALRPDGSGRRRVVLATDIAETSLTIDGITAVVDCGLTRKPRFQPGSGLTRLVTEPISRASAEQRAGRAGRLGPGVCYRAWTRAQEQGRPAHRPAEILQADLAPLALELGLWGVADPQALRWLDPPPTGAWAQGIDLLRQLGALDASGKITAQGRRMAALPLHPRLARMLVEAPASARWLATDLAALLEERDPWINRRDLPRPADLMVRLGALAATRGKQHLEGFDARRLQAIDRLSKDYLRLLSDSAAADGASQLAAQAPYPADQDPGALLALAYPDRIAQNRGGTGERFLLSGGAGAALPRGDALAIEPYLVVADLNAASGDNRIRTALPVSEAALRRLLAERTQEQRLLGWDQQREAVAARIELRLDALVLESRAVPISDLDAALDILLDAIANAFEQALNWTPAARQLQARVMLARRMQPDADWPDLSQDWLQRHVADWLGPWLVGKTRFADARALNLVEVLKQRLGWQLARRLDELAPERLTTPAGTQRRIDYCASADPPASAEAQGQAAPVLAAPMQELYGSADTPTIFNGRLPLRLHLLSPARRPLQVTSDLAGFWNDAYAEVRKEMRGRYPKHHWPENPASSHAIAGGLKRRKRHPPS